jgi:hypothetical protein
MDNTHAILWTARERDRWGLGTRRFSKEEAEALANQLNEEHDEFVHRPIDMTSQEPAAVVAAMRSAEAAGTAHIVSYPELAAAEAAAAIANELVDEKVVWLRTASRVSAADVPAA